MIKEEFDAEVYEYAKSRIDTEDSRMTDRMLAYRAGAEPREKRIEELEHKLEQTEKDLADYQFNYPTIKELEKENEKLQEELKKWKDEWQEQVQKATDEGYARTLQTIQLTKAKELLAKWVELFKPKSDTALPTPIQVDTEQFLKEIGR